MIVDSSALPEQIVDDVITSAFRSAGQRCSALRVLFVQDGIADKVIKMLDGACQELILDDPSKLSTDIGPVIDEEARSILDKHAARMDKEAKFLTEVKSTEEKSRHGYFFPPRAYEIESLAQLPREVFGPILHVIRYRADDIDKVIEQINATGYGLTFGIHTRIDHQMRAICSKVTAGNYYVNRSMIGAVVGVQPFGGQGLSGTGPKAGGPHYLMRFATERTMSINTTASGGNTTLVSLAEG
jgi:RHH-type proline utilization regulon transcriptional repressor/proline dehydrogenase/delta 1-pyrroline-5-carboxylate dehydrogenase